MSLKKPFATGMSAHLALGIFTDAKTSVHAVNCLSCYFSVNILASRNFISEKKGFLSVLHLLAV